jgi:hypothetical protein
MAALRWFLVGLLIAVGTPAWAGSVSAPFAVSATVVVNCRPQSAQVVCTKGSPPPRIETVTLSGIETTGGTTVTVNY